MRTKPESDVASTILVAIIYFFIASLLVMLLWNYLMPVLFIDAAIGQISYWQAAGLFMLCNTLFKSHK